VAAAFGLVAFASGVATATYLLRLRDRERLRQACSRTQLHLRKTTAQRASLGPLFLDRYGIRQQTKHCIVVIGAGNYGTAMGYTACRNGHDVVFYMRDEQQCQIMNEKGFNSKYLSDYSFKDLSGSVKGICTTRELGEQLQTPGVVVFLALPCQKTPDFLREHRNLIPDHVLLCSTAKGLYLPTKQLIGHAILDALDRAQQPLAFLSGPSFAEEVVRGFPTAVVVASDQLYLAVLLQKIMSNSESFRVYASQDPIGVQLAGALKNPLAVGAGMIAGLGYGTNTLSACVTRASRELCDLCIAMGGNPKTIDGLSGIGDLMLTCFSSQSRNQRCGQRLVQGEDIHEIQKDYTVEGVATAQVAVAYADMCGLELPLFRTVDALIQKHISPDDAVKVLMGRPLQLETDRQHIAYASMS